MEYSYFLLFLRSKSKFNLFARLIRYVFGTNYDHVEVVIRMSSPMIGNRFSTCFGAPSGRWRKISYAQIYKNYDYVKMSPLKLNVDHYTALGMLKALVGLSATAREKCAWFVDLCLCALTARSSNPIGFPIVADANSEILKVFLKSALQDADVLKLNFHELDKNWTA